jgi:hypothetical protein
VRPPIWVTWHNVHLASCQVDYSLPNRCVHLEHYVGQAQLLPGPVPRFHFPGIPSHHTLDGPQHFNLIFKLTFQRHEAAATVLYSKNAAYSAHMVYHYAGGLYSLGTDSFTQPLFHHPASTHSQPSIPYYNPEVQDYIISTSNLQHPGSGTLRILPLGSAAGQYTSGRIKSIGTPPPDAKNIHQFQASLRLNHNSQNQKPRIWPAHLL